MSLIEIIEHNENIYQILEKPPSNPPKSPRYHSKLELELRARKIPQLARTFGYPEEVRKTPDQYLRKGHGIYPPVKKTDHKHISIKGVPPVPKRPPPGQKTPAKPKVNFCVLNIKKAIKSKAKPPQPRLVDSRNGHIKRIKGSGEVPEFCILPGFGKMPEYLLRRNRKIQKERERQKWMEENRESLCKLISAQEREKLLADLKQNWALLQKAFLQLPILTDTIPKIARKDKMEKDMKQLEQDIALIERNPYIYVFDPEAVGCKAKTT